MVQPYTTYSDIITHQWNNVRESVEQWMSMCDEKLCAADRYVTYLPIKER